MRRDVVDLRAFYASRLGRVAREMVGRKLGEAWGASAGLDVLGLGYPTPFLEDAAASAARCVVAMPAGQGVEVWPLTGRNLACLAPEGELPFRNALFDRVLAVHALEEADDPRGLLEEVARVLAPNGRLIVVAAARAGIWTHAEATPFGYGRPFARGQLEALLREAELEPTAWTRALYAPPWPATTAFAEAFEQVGARLWPAVGGVLLLEAVKRTFAVKPRAQPARVRRAPAGGLLQPQPGLTRLRSGAVRSRP